MYAKRHVGFGDYWWYVVVLMPFVYWIPLLASGIKTSKIKWIIWGVVYALPTFLLFFLNDNLTPANRKESPYAILALLFFVFWVVSVIHTFSIRKEYLYYLSQKAGGYSIKNANYRRSGAQQNSDGLSNKHNRMMDRILNLQNEIELQLKNTSKGNLITDNLSDVVKKYVKQVEELIKQDNHLSNLLRTTNEKEIDFKIRELRRKIDRTDNAELMQQYMDNITILEQNKKMINDIQDQVEVVNMKIDTAEMDLQQMKFNLLNVQNMTDSSNRYTYMDDFTNKSEELTNYVELLKENYR